MPINTTKKIFSFFFNHSLFGEPIRYLFIGGTCAVIDLLLLYILVNYFHLWYLYAATTSFVIVVLLGYFGQKYFTFRDQSKNHKKQFAVFFVVSGTSLAINTLCMFLFVSVAGIWYIASSVMTKFVVLIWNFIANKYFVFKKKPAVHG